MSLLLPGTISYDKVFISEQVIHNLCNAFIKRLEGRDWIIGILAGHIENKIATISNCHSVSWVDLDFNVSKDILVQKNFGSQHQRIFDQDYFIGWFSLGKGMAGITSLLQNDNLQEHSALIYLTLGSDFPISGISTIHLYTSRVIKLDDIIIGAELLEIPRELIEHTSNRYLEKIDFTKPEFIPSYHEGIEDALYRLRSYIYATLHYIHEARTNKKTNNDKVGHYIKTAVSEIVDVLTNNEIEKALSNTYIENLSVIYLAKLIKMQMIVADSLETAYCPIGIL